MGSGNITTRSDFTAITASWFNEVLAVLSADVLPRDGTCAVTDEAASLGTSGFPWKRLYAQGDFVTGDIKVHHSYNGLLPPGQGWMLCDGRQVNRVNYETEHGAGTWAKIGGSVLQDKFLPNLTNRYCKGTTNTTTQDGSIAITAVGTPGNSANVTHKHSWYQPVASVNAVDNSFNPIGNPQAFTPKTGHSKTSPFRGFAQVIGFSIPQEMFTETYSGSVDIRPDSIEVQFYMRVI